MDLWQTFEVVVIIYAHSVFRNTIFSLDNFDIGTR